MPNNNGQFNIGGKRRPSGQRFTPSVRGVTGAGPARAEGPGGRGSMPGLRRGGASHGGSQNTPGLRKKEGGKGKGLGPARGAVIQEGRVNGIQVRVSAPKAPNPNSGARGVIETSAQERSIRADVPPDMMAAQSTQMIAGQPARQGAARRGRGRGRVTQDPAPTPTVTQMPQQPIIDAEVVEKVQAAPEKPVLPPGAYWSDKYERYVIPGEPEYSQETAQRMGVA